MSSYFQIHEYTIPGQHIRAYPGGTRLRQEDVLHIAVKHYVPVDRIDPAPENAVTIIACHGNGYAKELYEPFIETLCERLKSKGLHVRGIWMADNSNQGASGILNESTHGEMIDYYDSSRDLLLMVNHFRHEMPRPIVGFAHSYGCPILVQLSLMHPRLLSTLVLCEPILFYPIGMNMPNPGSFSFKRRELWPTRAEAEQRVRRGFKQQNWDERVIELYLKYGLRDVPTLLFDPDQDAKVPKTAVTLTTTKHQETWSYNQTNFEEADEKRDRIIKPYQSSEELQQVVARSELTTVHLNLPHVRPSVFYVYGTKSMYAPMPVWRERNYEVTGTGRGGSGGAKIGKVKQLYLKGAGHLIPMEKGALDQLADASADWLRDWFQTWLEEEQIIKVYGRPAADQSGLRLSELNIAVMKLNSAASPRLLKSLNKL